MDLLGTGRQEKPTRGEKLLRSGRTSEPGTGPEYAPVCPGSSGTIAVNPGATSRFAMRRNNSEIGEL